MVSGAAMFREPARTLSMALHLKWDAQKRLSPGGTSMGLVSKFVSK